MSKKFRINNLDINEDGEFCMPVRTKKVKKSKKVRQKEFEDEDKDFEKEEE